MKVTEVISKFVKTRFSKKADEEKEGPQNPNPERVFGQSSVSSEKKVDLIVHYLQKRYDRTVAKRIKLSGYIDAPMYALELSLVRSGYSDPAPYLVIVGKETADVLKVNEVFLEKYWRDREIQHDYETGKEKPFAVGTLEFYQKQDIASSESELLLKAEIEGIL